MKKIKTSKLGDYNFRIDEVGKVEFIEPVYKSLEQKRQLKEFEVKAEIAIVICNYSASPTSARVSQRFINLFEREYITAIKICNEYSINTDVLLQFKKVINPDTTNFINPDEKINLFRELVAFNSEKRTPAKKNEPLLFGLPFQSDGETGFRELLSDLQCQDMILTYNNQFCVHAVSKESAYRTLISILYYADEQELLNGFFMLTNKWKTAADIFLMKIGDSEPERIDPAKLRRAFCACSDCGTDFHCDELNRVRGL